MIILLLLVNLAYAGDTSPPEPKPEEPIQTMRAGDEMYDQDEPSSETPERIRIFVESATPPDMEIEEEQKTPVRLFPTVRTPPAAPRSIRRVRFADEQQNTTATLYIPPWLRRQALGIVNDEKLLNTSEASRHPQPVLLLNDNQIEPTVFEPSVTARLPVGHGRILYLNDTQTQATITEPQPNGEQPIQQHFRVTPIDSYLNVPSGSH